MEGRIKRKCSKISVSNYQQEMQKGIEEEVEEEKAINEEEIEVK